MGNWQRVNRAHYVLEAPEHTIHVSWCGIPNLRDRAGYTLGISSHTRTPYDRRRMQVVFAEITSDRPIASDQLEVNQDPCTVPRILAYEDQIRSARGFPKRHAGRLEELLEAMNAYEPPR